MLPYTASTAPHAKSPAENVMQFAETSVVLGAWWVM
jgi:hypothetical protein